MPSEGRGGLGRNRSTVSSRLEAQGTPFGRASKRRRGLGSNRFQTSSMPESKGTRFGCQVKVAADSGGTALPSPRGRERREPPFVVLAKGGGSRKQPFFLFIHVAIEGNPLWKPSDRRGGLGRNRSTVSSRPRAQGTPFGRASKRRRGLGSNRFETSSMPESKGTPFGGQVKVAADSGGTALPSPRAWKRREPPFGRASRSPLGSKS